jgi:hypothetical protein
LRNLSGLNESLHLEHLTLLSYNSFEGLMPFKSLKRLTVCDRTQGEALRAFKGVKVDVAK